MRKIAKSFVKYRKKWKKYVCIAQKIWYLFGKVCADLYLKTCYTMCVNPNTL